MMEVVLIGEERSESLVFVVKEGATWYDSKGGNFEVRLSLYSSIPPKAKKPRPLPLRIHLFAHCACQCSTRIAMCPPFPVFSTCPVTLHAIMHLTWYSPSACSKRSTPPASVELYFFIPGRFH